MYDILTLILLFLTFTLMKNHVLFLILFFFTLTTAHARQNLFVSTTGCDDASGAENAPLRTIAAAILKARTLPGQDTVVVHIASGTYFLDRPVILTDEDVRPVVFEGDPSDMPVISGGYKISGWEVTPEGWWKTRVPEVVKYGKLFEQLYVNDRRAILARTPDKGLFKVIGQVVQTPLATDGRDEGYGYHVQRYATDPENLKGLKDLNSGSWTTANEQTNNLRIHLFQAWDDSYKIVDYMVPDSGFVFVHGTKLHQMYSYHNLFRLENYKGALNAPGEWFLDGDGELTYIPLEGEDPRTAEVFAPALKNLLIVKGDAGKPVSGKVFRNLSFRHTAYSMPIKGTTPYQAAVHLDAAVMVRDAEGILLENCEIKHTGNYGLLFQNVRDCTVGHTFLNDLGGGGIRIDYSRNVQVLNNIIRKGGQVFPAGVGVLIRQASGIKVLHNDICDLRYSGVSVGWVWGYGKSLSFDNEIGFNHIHHLGWGELDDMGGVYTLGIQPGTTVHDNVIHDVYSHDYGGWGLYTDEGSSHIVMENNLVYACKCGGFHQHYGEDNIIRNNIFAWSIWQQLQWSRTEDHRSFTFAHNIILNDGFPFLSRSSRWRNGNADFEQNCFWDITCDKPYFDDMTPEEFRQMRDPKMLVADPLFRDPLHGDFTFKRLKTAKKIGFKPFDYSRAGIQGDDAWKAKARMAPEELEDFREAVRNGETEYLGSEEAEYRPPVARRPGIDRIYPRYYD